MPTNSTTARRRVCAMLVFALVLIALIPAALAYNWSGYGHVKQLYVRNDGATTFFFTQEHRCDATSNSNYFIVEASHPGHDRLFGLLHSALLNGVNLSVDYTCDGKLAKVGTVKTEGLH